MLKQLLFLVIFVILISSVYAQCNDGLKYFEGGCYSCDGYLYKKEGNIACINCDESSYYDGNGNCKLKQSPSEQRSFGTYLDYLSTKVSPDNPLLGFILVLIVISFIAHYLYKKYL